ncbi:MAG: metallophosphoesterase [Bacteroidetes bacterium]|nr:metallophosphoesterase [Bacteroidota bacterium]
MKLKTTILLAFTGILTINAQTTNIIPSGSLWRYLDDGSDQQSAWKTPAFNDLNWAVGNAELGYGDSDEATTVSYGVDGNNKHITTYFRKQFNVTNPLAFNSLNLEIVRDDGAVIYINGNEVWRSNMPAGSIDYNTEASNTVAWPTEDDWQAATISAGHLVAGTNVIAVEIHQDDRTSSDISFNLKLDGISTPINAIITRGPYLQKATPTGIIIKWRTDVACDSKILYGNSYSNLNNTVIHTGFGTEHEVEIINLNPYTKYFYSVGNYNSILAPAAPDLSFVTLPASGTIQPYRFWVIGDAGTGSNDQRAVRDAFINYNNGQHIDGWIWLGDNAYEGGKDDEYQDHVFSNEYEGIMKNTVTWPSPGNHDYNNHIPFSPAPAYYNIFSLPTNGESGGLASGTEKYYSYNIGNIHFISLDSYDENRNTNAPMATWLLNDLNANTLPWIIAYWHHPPYTKGTHDSDNPLLYDFEMVDMRENILPILESHGVDLILGGHSHVYERSMLIDGHYDNSNTLQPNMILDNTSGNYHSGACPYEKHMTINEAHKGTVYSVVGCSAKSGSPESSWPHPVMHKYSSTDLGSMLLEINNNRLDAKFIKTDGSIYDSFSIFKNMSKNETVNACPGDQITLKPSFSGTALWQPINTSGDSLNYSVLNNTTVYANDINGCITDTFNIQLLPANQCNLTGISTNNLDFSVNTIQNNEQLELNIKNNENELMDLAIYNALGQQIETMPIQTINGSASYSINVSNYKSGIYFLEVKNEHKRNIKRIFIHQ